MNDVLQHYASPYYDPVKAHQYYEEHKKLKGRNSTVGLNEKGKEAAKYIKKSLDEERAANTKKREAQKKRDLEQHSLAMATGIKQIQQRLLQMSPQEKAEHLGEITNEVARLREQNAARREEILKNYAAASGNTKEEYANKYASELERLKADPSMRAQKKGKTAKKKKEANKVSKGDYDAWVRQNKADYAARRKK